MTTGCEKHHLINCTECSRERSALRLIFERNTYQFALECIVNDKKIGTEELGVAAEWYKSYRQHGS